jgi:DNA-directed RNA polymerase specialized sigma subunit
MAPNCGRDADELVSYGYVGLHRAAEMFDATLGFAFSTYAVPKTKGAILDGLRTERPWSARQDKDRNAYRRVVEECRKVGEAPTDEELADRLGWAVERVLLARRLNEPRPVSDEFLIRMEAAHSGPQEALGGPDPADEQLDTARPWFAPLWAS